MPNNFVCLSGNSIDLNGQFLKLSFERLHINFDAGDFHFCQNVGSRQLDVSVDPQLPTIFKVRDQHSA